jgi:hypothetical protein
MQRMLFPPDLEFIKSWAVLRTLGCGCHQLLHHKRLLPRQVNSCTTCAALQDRWTTRRGMPYCVVALRGMHATHLQYHK